MKDKVRGRDTAAAEVQYADFMREAYRREERQRERFVDGKSRSPLQPPWSAGSDDGSLVSHRSGLGKLSSLRQAQATKPMPPVDFTRPTYKFKRPIVVEESNADVEMLGGGGLGTLRVRKVTSSTRPNASKEEEHIMHIPGYMGFTRGKKCLEKLPALPHNTTNLVNEMEDLSMNLTSKMIPVYDITQRIPYRSSSQMNHQYTRPKRPTETVHNRTRGNIKGYGNFSQFLDSSIRTKISLMSTGH